MKRTKQFFENRLKELRARIATLTHYSIKTVDVKHKASIEKEIEDTKRSLLKVEIQSNFADLT